MPSRKVRLKRESPYKGTGRYIEYLRCPCCGKLARGQVIGAAGQHMLSVSRCKGPKPGYRTGFDWEHVPPDRETLEALRIALERALRQVKQGLGYVPLMPVMSPALMPVISYLPLAENVYINREVAHVAKEENSEIRFARVRTSLL